MKNGEIVSCRRNEVYARNDAPRNRRNPVGKKLPLTKASLRIRCAAGPHQARRATAWTVHLVGRKQLRAGSMVVRPIRAVVTVAAVEPSADVTSPWGRREQDVATSGMVSLLLELQLLTLVPGRPSSLRRPPARGASAAPHLAGHPRRVQSQRTGEEQAALADWSHPSYRGLPP
jgi:hypothetical protein